MKTRLTPYYIQLVYDACLKSFWRRKAVVKFLSQCGVADGFLRSWSTDESKRDLLDRLFDKLPKSDGGKRVIVRMAGFLIEQKSFPDLLNWEDSEKKLKDAHDAVQKLRIHHNAQEEVIQTEDEREAARQRFREQQAKIVQSQQSLQKLNDRLTALVPKAGTQPGGYDFQDWFYDLADFSEVANRRPYNSNGRQIDGALTISGTTYLVELKFSGSAADATDIDSIFKKVTSKADNTMGVIVSIAGFTQVARKEASSERTPLLLLDHGHIYLVLGGIMSLAEVINRIRRHASQTGDAYLAAGDFGG